MLRTVLLTSLLAFGAIAAPGGQLSKKAVCNADNCLRVVRASSTLVKQPQASADCQSYFATTSHLAPLPSYASACSNIARYSSACACAGFLASTSISTSMKVTTTTTTTKTTSSVAPMSAVVTTTTTAGSTSSTTTPTMSTTTAPTTTITSAGSTTVTTTSFTTTSSTAVTLTTTTSSTAPTCSQVRLMPVGEVQGIYLTDGWSLVIYSGYFTLIPGGLPFAVPLTLDKFGRFGVEMNYVASVADSFAGLSQVEYIAANAVPAYTSGQGAYSTGPHALFCSIPLNQDASGFEGPVSCQAWDGSAYQPAVFQACPNIDYVATDGYFSLFVDSVLATAVDSSCTEIGLYAYSDTDGC